MKKILRKTWLFLLPFILLCTLISGKQDHQQKQNNVLTNSAEILQEPKYLFTDNGVTNDLEWVFIIQNTEYSDIKAIKFIVNLIPSETNEIKVINQKYSIKLKSRSVAAIYFQLFELDKKHGRVSFPNDTLPEYTYKSFLSSHWLYFTVLTATFFGYTFLVTLVVIKKDYGFENLFRWIKNKWYIFLIGAIGLMFSFTIPLWKITKNIMVIIMPTVIILLVILGLVLGIAFGSRYLKAKRGSKCREDLF